MHGDSYDVVVIGAGQRVAVLDIGECHECLVEIDGEPNRQACMVEARAGMRVRRQHGARRAEG